MSITLIIIIVTVITSFASFSNQTLMDKLIFYPPAVSERNEWYRFISCGFIHADIGHLIFNMYALYLFGDGPYHSGLEGSFTEIFGGSGKLLYLLMYLGALAACMIPTYKKNISNYHYRSLGASGAVSAVIFANILLHPIQGMGLFFVPVFVAGFIFGGLYIAVSYWLDQRGGGNVNHSAHIWGGVFGMLFLFVCARALANYPVLSHFVEAIKEARPQDFIHFGSGF